MTGDQGSHLEFARGFCKRTEVVLWSVLELQSRTADDLRLTYPGAGLVMVQAGYQGDAATPTMLGP